MINKIKNKLILLIITIFSVCSFTLYSNGQTGNHVLSINTGVYMIDYYEVKNDSSYFLFDNPNDSTDKSAEIGVISISRKIGLDSIVVNRFKTPLLTHIEFLDGKTILMISHENVKYNLMVYNIVDKSVIYKSQIREHEAKLNYLEYGEFKSKFPRVYSSLIKSCAVYKVGADYYVMIDGRTMNKESVEWIRNKLSINHHMSDCIGITTSGGVPWCDIGSLDASLIYNNNMAIGIRLLSRSNESDDCGYMNILFDNLVED